MAQAPNPPQLPPYRSARALAWAYHDKRTFANIAYFMPNSSRDYAFEFSSVMIISGGDGEYHPPNPDISDEKKEEYRIRSLKRARRKFLNFALANDFRYMLTLTLDPKHKKFVLLNNKQKMRQTFKDIHRNQKHDYRYLAVCELQKNGNCHLHILATKELKKYLNKNHFGKLEFSSWRKYGFTNIRKIKQSDYEKQTSYLTKYLFKEKGEKVYNYFRSQNLATPKIVHNVDLSDFVLDSEFETEYGITVYNLKRRKLCKK